MSSSQTSEHRIYLVLQQILKELSSKRLPADQKLLHEVTPCGKSQCTTPRIFDQESLSFIKQINSTPRYIGCNCIDQCLVSAESWWLLSKLLLHSLISCNLMWDLCRMVVKISQELFTPFWQQWCSDSQAVVSALETMGHLEREKSESAIVPVLQRWILLGKVSWATQHGLFEAKRRMLKSESVICSFAGQAPSDLTVSMVGNETNAGLWLSKRCTNLGSMLYSCSSIVVYISTAWKPPFEETSSSGNQLWAFCDERHCQDFGSSLCIAWDTPLVSVVWWYLKIGRGFAPWLIADKSGLCCLNSQFRCDQVQLLGMKTEQTDGLDLVLTSVEQTNSHWHVGFLCWKFKMTLLNAP